MRLQPVAVLLLAVSGFAAAQPEPRFLEPEEAGFDSGRLEGMRQNLVERRTNALLVVRRGRIVLEWYAPGHGPAKPEGTASLAKALVGGLSLMLAMNDGRIAPDDLASKYITQWKADPLKAGITIRQLATHSSGVEDAEQDGLPQDQLPGWKGAFWASRPEIARDDAPVIFKPGTRFAYSNPGMALLAYAGRPACAGQRLPTFGPCSRPASFSRSASQSPHGRSVTAVLTKSTTWTSTPIGAAQPLLHEPQPAWDC